MKKNDKKKKAVKNVRTKKPDVKTPPKAAPAREKRVPLGIAPYIIFALAAFIAITYFISDSGFLGKYIKLVLFGLFGAGAYFLPVYMAFIAIFWKRDHENGVYIQKLFLALGSFLCVLTLIHLFSPAPAAADGVGFMKNLYEYGSKTLTDAGAIGGAIGTGIQTAIGYVAALIFSVLLAIIMLIFFFGSTPKRVVKYIADIFRSAAVSDAEQQDEPAKEPVKQPEIPRAPAVDEKPDRRQQQIPFDVVYSGEQPRRAEPMKPTAVPGVEINRSKPFTVDEINSDYKKIFEEDGTHPAPKEEKAAEPVAEVELTPAPKPAEKPVQPAAPAEKASEPLEAVTETVSESSEPPYIFPPVSLLTADNGDGSEESYESIVETGRKLVEVLSSYGVNTKLVSTSRGPAVTRYELLPDAGVRVSKIANLSDDIRMRLASTNIRIETNIPGKAAVGIEIPNKKPATVRLRSLIENSLFTENKSKLYVCLGVDVGGNPVYFDIPDMPHLLIAGATGMGKSVCINSIIISLIYRARPDEVKLILIDPKKIELATYNDIPHLFIPVVNEPKKAAGALNWAVVEMEKRYTLMQEVGDARNMKEYNEMIEGDPEREKLPYIVIIIDELADLIMSAPDEVETSICRLAQKARAAGIYLIIGTQRPSVDVITGLIKANIPSRIAFTVQSQIDSRTIIDIAGAEKLCGRGDMLFAPVKELKPIRVQGAFVDGKSEVAAVCSFVRNAAKATYDDDVIKQIEAEARLCGVKPSQRAKEEAAANGGDVNEDPLFLDAIGVAFEFETMSTSLLQRRLSVGYSRAQKMIDMMEDRGYVGKFDAQTKKRKINITFEEYQQLRLNKEGGENDASEKKE